MKQIYKVAVVSAVLGMAITTPSFAEEQMRDVTGFTSVELAGSMDAKIEVGPKFSVTVKADSKYIDRVITERDGNALEIKMERGHSRYKGKILVTVTMPFMKNVSLAGSGDISVEGASGDFGVELAGSGDIMIIGDGPYGDVEVELAGSGDITIEGTCNSVDIELAGSGDIDARGMKCEAADVSIAGSGDVSAHASKSAKVMILGSGDVDIYGKPDSIKSTGMGSGSLSTH